MRRQGATTQAGGSHHAQDAEESGSADQILRDLRPAVRLEKEMGESLGRGEILLGPLPGGCQGPAERQGPPVTALRFVLGDQLTRDVSSLKGLDPATDTVLMVEVAAEATYVRHHQQKIAFIFSAMRHFAESLRAEGIRVDYVTLDDPANTHSFTDELARAVARHRPSEVFVTEPGEWRVWEMMLDWREEIGAPVHIRPDDRFLCTREAFAAWAAGRKQYRMEFFYREMRRRTGFLMDGDQPVGGQWNFDHDNRKRLPDALIPPPRLRFAPDAITREVIDLVARRFGNHFGDLEPFGWAVTRPQALAALDHFIADCLPSFGDYQDAMKTGEDFLFHGVISPYLNCGLLTAREVCARAEAAYEAGKAPLNAVEGFIRQVLGWREFVRGLYWTEMPAYAATNHLNATRPLPDFFWTGETDLRCLKECVRATRQHAYAHHIQRLMVTGNFVLLAGIRPAEIEEWYLVVYADAYDWVELPNVHGMVLHADGGLLASKPYAASGAYIDRMSDYCRSCRYDPALKSGPDACPFNALYWNFLIENEAKLAGNPRMAMPYRTLAKMTPARRAEIVADASAFLDSLPASGAWSGLNGAG
jgi:deoxyribodipyrimidine photolyase-related protein